ncbi:anthranilate synthase component II [Eupransor demetentiae]|uniref:Anthranilate/para-aminobenzoate synthase component II (Glutamine amidotransferase) (PabA) n=1 Tax=Eupransor demetentiae TaxID=3109584 RepID=A0ABM9N404_9LACO|nr:Anthranilate/para-aminobenzoate synthase component II (glutamine amidotransferase) (PabA) [Lactobacillaceae bacterium LMG 33000]
MILLVDNYDSFTYNLAQIVGQYADVEVLRNDDPKLAEAAKEADGIIFSPGPGAPSEAGQMEDLIREHQNDKAMLGICLGHQAIGEVFGGRVDRADEIRHGKVSEMKTQGGQLFGGVSELPIMRYHSLIIDRSQIPEGFKITGLSEDDDEIMAIEHKDLPIYGLQFHPESIGTPSGEAMIKRFIEICKQQQA